mmetsp:Transcript_65533/g.147877  ORF Transcript_65533/g.147877 Transcript_65533/m.147877 type:complete len:296 (+) Transcript_65533:68-955(+)|eukprot:CAMPEP_0172645952 /NCGR_PEP_ID=MMETSP1068-20121228/239994_1 /TAXON_ID=35684 /ORGANISM="Pseudopedinella elastica, Strain CCMP716" /LENGTH=295 /DNA_ID=CAMNT_0013460201 /DNA_START=587 /DNA_END=1474 /DNA_ORIENTATION=-
MKSEGHCVALVCALFVGLFIGRLTTSLPFEWRLLRESDSDDRLASLWLVSLASPPCVLLEATFALLTPLAALIAAWALFQRLNNSLLGLSWLFAVAAISGAALWQGWGALCFTLSLGGVSGDKNPGGSDGGSALLLDSFAASHGLGALATAHLLGSAAALAWAQRRTSGGLARGDSRGGLTGGLCGGLVGGRVGTGARGSSGGVRDLTDRAIREYGKLHDFLNGGGGGSKNGGLGESNEGGAFVLVDRSSPGSAPGADPGGGGAVAAGEAARAGGESESDVGHLRDFEPGGGMNG